jgi:hypothetical protein
MSAGHETAAAPDWYALMCELVAIRTAAQAEKRVHGQVLPETRQRMDEALARAEAAIVIDGAMQPDSWAAK